MRRLFLTSTRRIRWQLLACIAVAILGNGCGGINASHSVSPLDFFLPGYHFLKTPASDGTNSTVTLTAANR
jgi:hypothetical protein